MSNMIEDAGIPLIDPKKLDQRLMLAEMTKRALLLRGGPGVGKSQIFQAYARRRRMVEGENGFGYIDSRPLYFDPTDVKGFPSLNREEGTSSWLPPSQFPLQKNVDAGRVPPKGLWAIEELPSATPAVQAAFYQVILDRELNGEPIAEGWSTVATGNRLIDRAVVNRMPSPLVSRFWHLELSVPTEQWAMWAMGEDETDEPITVPDFSPEFRVHHIITAFFRFRPELLNSFDPHNWIQDTPYCCPRSAEILSNLVEAYSQISAGKWPIDVVKGTIGEAVGTELWSYLDIIKDLPTIDQILMDPMKAPVPDGPAMLYAIGAALARRVEKGNAKRVFDYVMRMPKEFEVSVVRDFTRTAQEIMNTAEFTAWTLKNAKAMSRGDDDDE